MRKTKKVEKKNILWKGKGIYILLVVGFLCVAKIIYSYGEMGIVAQGRGDDTSEQGGVQEDEQEGVEKHFDEEIQQGCLDGFSADCPCGGSVGEHGVSTMIIGGTNGDDIESGSGDKGCNDNKDCNEDEDCNHENGENDDEKCKLCGEDSGQFGEGDCILCEECRGCLECMLCEGCSECVRCTGKERCASCEKCERCITCSVCQGCIQCEECLRCEDCVKCLICEDDIIYNEDQLPRIRVKEPDGAMGYYLKAPEIWVTHQLERVTVHYEFTNGATEKVEGIIPVGEDVLLDSVFKEGENTLFLWVELPDQVWEDYRVLKLDSTAPRLPVIELNKPEINGTIYSSDIVNATFQSSDCESGVYGYFYKIGSSNDVFITGEIGTITISEEFVGQVEVTAIDYAGNRSEVAKSSLIIIDKNQPMIRVVSTEELGAWNQQALSIVLQIEEWGVSSGIENVRAYIDGEMVLNRKLGQGEMEYSFRESLHIEKEALNGVGANLRVEARDYVGHEAVIHQEILIDTKNPIISFPDSFNNMIIGDDRTVEILLEDNNLLSYYQVLTTYSPFYGEEGQSDSFIRGEISSVSQNVSINLDKEGKYIIEVLARDVSGREATNTLNVFLDKTSPIIRYVEQLNGKHIPYFHWNYRSEDMIQEEHGFDYNMFLDGRRYIKGTIVDREGEHTFRVTAVDEAGNIGSAYANFVIDNTPPEIYFYNVAQGESYEEQLMVGIAVTDYGERIKKVMVNGENSNIERNSQMVQLRFNKAEGYTIVVEADDLAGNVSIEEMKFSVVAPAGEMVANSSVKGRLSEYVDKAFGKEGGILQNRLLSLPNTDSVGKGVTVVGLGIGLLIVGSGVAYVLYKCKLKRNEKERVMKEISKNKLKEYVGMNK